ncbi:hypothetical protein AB0B67_39885, partial [Streptomyces spectabilis]
LAAEADVVEPALPPAFADWSSPVWHAYRAPMAQCFGGRCLGGCLCLPGGLMVPGLSPASLRHLSGVFGSQG